MAGFLGDITGSFDRVFKDYMMAKLVSVGVSPLYLDFLNAYLQPRIGYVAMDSVFSDAFTLCDTVFQGTVLGPYL